MERIIDNDMRLYKEYAELNRPSELIVDKAEYIKILKEADLLLLLIKKALGKDV